MTEPEKGIVFPENSKGKRSSTAVVKQIFSNSVAEIRPDLSAAILKEKKWRKNYLRYINKINITGIQSAQNPLKIAADGLDQAYRTMRFIRDNREMTFDQAMSTFKAPLFHTGIILGGLVKDRHKSFCLPYKNRLLSGRRLMDQIDDWENRGIFEPSFASAVRNTVRNNKWTDVSEMTFVIMGAGSEIAPLQTLLELGATVIAIDLARPDIWKQLIRTARKSPGKLIFPLKKTFNKNLKDDLLSAMAGADLICDTPEISTWLRDMNRPMTIGAYAYADGAQHVKIAMAMDAIIKNLTTDRNDHTVAFLLTPSDSFAVPMKVVQASLANQKKYKDASISLSFLQSTARFLSRGRMFAPHNRVVVESDNEKTYGLSDNMISQQGPGYILAKNIQKWRSLVCRGNGIRVSANVAPATTTKSVFKNKILAAGYAGLAHFKAEAFRSETTRAIMAAALLSDLNDETGAANPETPLDHPLDLFVQTANHGGLWRIAFEPKTILGFSVILGCIKAIKRKLSFEKEIIHAKETKESLT